MKPFDTRRHTALLFALTVSAAAVAQTPKPSAALTGVSHPEQIPVTTSADGIAQPIVFDETAPRPMLQARYAPPAAMAEVPNPDGSLISSAPPPQEPRDTWGNIRQPLVSSEPDPDAGFVTRVEGPANQMPTGTLLKVVLRRPLSTRSTRLGSPFTAELGESVRRDGRILIPAGSLVTGKITEVHGGSRLSGAASIHLEPTLVTLPDGTEYRVHGQLIDTGLYHSTKLDAEGTLRRRMHPGQTLAVLALTTGSGAAAGALLGGAPGALIGAGVGAGISTVIWLKEDRQTELPTGTKLCFALSAPVTVGER